MLDKIKEKFSKVSYILWLKLGCCLSIYIIIASLIPCLQFDAIFLSDETVRRLNDILQSLSVSYLMGVFVYYLTGPLRYKKERKKRIWELYDIYVSLQKVSDELVETMADRQDLITIDIFRDRFRKENFDKFQRRSNSILEKLGLYRNILTEKEIEIIANVRKVTSIEEFNEYMETEEIEMNHQTLTTLFRNITKLYNNICMEVRTRK